MRIALGLRDRFALVGRALTGAIDLEPGSVGGRLLGGVIQSGGTPPTRGTREYLQAYSQMPWLRAVAARVSYDVAAVDWQLLTERRAGRAVRNRALQRAQAPQRAILRKQLEDAGDMDILTDHPALDLLHSANPVQTGLQMRRVTQLHLDLVGEAFWLLERGALNEPIAIWPIPPSWIQGTPTLAHPFYRVSFRAWQGVIPATEIIWFCDPDPANPYGRGTGTAQALGDELETDEYTARHVKSFFFNRARPDLIVYPVGEGTLEEDQVERLEEEWSSRNRGFWRAFRPFFLRREVGIKELDQNFRSQQLVQLREFERDSILQVFGVSPETLGILSKGSNRATVTMGDVIYSKRVLVPRLELLRSVMQERLLPAFDERLILDYASPVSRDDELELNAMKVAPWAATIDEHRERQGLDPLPDERGTLHVLPLTSQVTTLNLAPPPRDPAGPVPEPGEDDPDEDLEAMAAAGDIAARKAYLKALEPSADDDPSGTQLAERLVGGYRRAQERAWRGLRVNEEAMATALRLGDADRAVEAVGQQALVTALREPLREHGRPAFLRAVALALRELPPRGQREPIAVDVVDLYPEATRWAEAEAARLVAQVGPDARAAIQALIVASVAEGIDPRVIARRIRDEGLIALLPRQVAAVERFRAALVARGLAESVITRRVAKYATAQLRLRAMTIARTEILTAVNAGQQALWETAVMRGILPPTVTRRWLVTWDERLEAECESLADKEVGLHEEFAPGIMQPPLHVNCRCSVGIASVPRGA